MQIHNMAFYSISANNIGVYTSCTIWYNLDTPPAVPLMFEAAMIQNRICKAIYTMYVEEE